MAAGRGLAATVLPYRQALLADAGLEGATVRAGPFRWVACGGGLVGR